MSQQQSPNTVSIDEIPVDIDNTRSAEINSADVPDEIESITRELASKQPPPNPVVVLKAARWWYLQREQGECLGVVRKTQSSMMTRDCVSRTT